MKVQSTCLCILKKLTIFQYLTSMNYRTPGLPEGAASHLGTLHVHVDGLEVELLTSITKELERLGFPGKVHSVLDFVEGPQRTDEPSIYEVHTTGFSGREIFSSFSTCRLDSRRDILPLLKFLFESVPREQGVVIELEKVCARVNPQGVWEEKDLHSTPDLQPSEAPLPPRHILPIEKHHMVDVSTAVPPIPLKGLLKRNRVNTIPFGGWFSFEKPGIRAYRSNSFSTPENLREEVLREHQWVAEHESLQGVDDFTVRTLVERVLGVWRV